MKKIYGVLFALLSALVLAGCEEIGSGGAATESMTALETEVASLREEFGTFRQEWDGFYQDWGTYREEIGLGGAEGGEVGAGTEGEGE